MEVLQPGGEGVHERIRRGQAGADRARGYGQHRFLQPAADQRLRAANRRQSTQLHDFRPEQLSRHVQRDGAERHVGPVAAHTRRPDRLLGDRQCAQHRGHLRRERRRQAQGVGRLHGAGVGQEHRRASDEPFVPFKTNAPETNNPNASMVNQAAVTQRAGFTDGAEILTLRAAIADYAQWSTTPLDYTFNPFTVLDGFVSNANNSNEAPLNYNVTLAVLQQARNSTRLVQAGNHTIGANFASVTFILEQLAADAQLDPAAAPASYQTCSPKLLGDTPGNSDYANWQAAVQIGVNANAGDIELWDYSENNGFLGLSPAQVSGLGTTLANGIAPTTGAPADGSALAFLAPGFVSGSTGAIAFTGVGALLLEKSAASQGTYTVTLTSQGGHTLAVNDFSGVVSGPTSGSTLSLSGTLDQVNTVLASLSDTLSSGSDVVQANATDGNGHTATRTVGVKVSAAPSPSPTTPATGPAPFTSNGLLVLGGVNAAPSYAGLQIGTGGVNTLLAALSPSAYSTASLTVGSTLEVLSGGNAFFSGTLGAQTVQVDAGGALVGNGTVAAGAGGTINNGTIEATADYTLGLQQLTLGNVTGTGTGTLQVDAGASLTLSGTVDATQTIQFAPNSVAQFAQGPYSPSKIVLQSPLDMHADITGFTFADRLVLPGVQLTSSDVTYNSSNQTLTITEGSVSNTFGLVGKLVAGVDVLLSNLNFDVVADPLTQSTVIGFVAPAAGLAPTVTAPSDLEGAAQVGAPGFPVGVPDIVVNTPQASFLASAPTLDVELVAAGTLSVGDDNGHTTVVGNGTSTVTLSGTVDAVERSLQTLTYTAPPGTAPLGATSDSITIFAGYGSIPATPAATINVHNNAAPLTFTWNTTDGAFDVAANWVASPHSSPPGGTNVASFGPGNYTVSGDGAVGELDVSGTTTLTGQITAQGRTGDAVVVDSGGALTLAGGALLTAQQEAVVGQSGQAVLVLMGAALDLTGPSAQNALVVGQNSGSNGTVVNLEQITADTVVVGGSGIGSLSLLGIASTVTDSGADIGQSAGSQGSVTVNGGEWMNSGTLTVGDVGTGSLTINGMAGGVSGQVTAFNATIGNQAGGQGSVTLDGVELLVANAQPSSSALETSVLAVGAGGTGDLALDNGSEVAVGAAQATVHGGGNVSNNGQLTVGGAASGQGQVSISGNSALLVYGNATVGGTSAASGAGTVTMGQSADDFALFALMGTLAINATGEIDLSGANALVRAKTVTVASGGVISGAGTLSGLGGGNNTVTLATIDNEGSIVASGGELLIYGNVEGTGSLSVADDGTLIMQGAVAANHNVAFGSSTQVADVQDAATQAAGSRGKLVLHDARAFSGTITGFRAGDVLKLAGVHGTDASWSNGVLTVDTEFGGPIRLHV